MHYFHFKHHIKMADRLWEISGIEITEKFAFEKFSVWLGEVIRRMSPLLKDMHYKEDARVFQYELIHQDRKLPRESLWAQLPEELYQRLKQIHKDLNRFSIAQLVRELIEVYLDYVDSEEGAEVRIRRLWRRVNQRERRYRKSGKPIRNKLPARLRTKKFHMKFNFRLVGRNASCSPMHPGKELPLATFYDPGGHALLIFLQ